LNPSVRQLFAEVFHELRPRTPLPDFDVRFFKFSNLNNTIRLRQGKIFVRLSDLLEGAPDQVLHAILHILVAKLYRKEIDPAQAARYRKFSGSEAIAAKMHLIRQMRGRKRIAGVQGEHYHLEEIFEDLNRRFFHGPGFNNTDFGFLKRTQIKGNYAFDLRIEFFNIFNHAQFANPGGDISSQNFGIVTNARDPRIGQVSAKFYW